LPDQPTSGELVFSYPDSEAKAATKGFLLVVELGQAFSDQSYEAWIRLRL
jgi:hypothetical protein